MICMSRRSAWNAAGPSAVTLRPSNQISPAVGSISRRMQRPVVDFPEPDSPTNPSVSPASMSKLTPSTAWTVAASREIASLGQAELIRHLVGRDVSLVHENKPAAATKKAETPALEVENLASAPLVRDGPHEHLGLAHVEMNSVGEALQKNPPRARLACLGRCQARKFSAGRTLKRGVDAFQPPAAKTPEVPKRAVALPARVRVGVECLGEWPRGDGSERKRTNLAIRIGADGLLMPAKKGQKPPDLRYFDATTR